MTTLNLRFPLKQRRACFVLIDTGTLGLRYNLSLNLKIGKKYYYEKELPNGDVMKHFSYIQK